MLITRYVRHIKIKKRTLSFVPKIVLQYDFKCFVFLNLQKKLSSLDSRQENRGCQSLTQTTTYKELFTRKIMK